MNIEERKISVGKLAEGYDDQAESGVFGYGGKLDIRPPYQREFIYKDKQREAVISTVMKGYPLNVMYWAVREDGTFEVIDGQQRTISLCQYIEGDFLHDGFYFHNLQPDEQQKILNYELVVYLCSGTDSERLRWFETINIAGERLTPQELRNAQYAGPWLSDAKRYFSKTGCVAYKVGSDYVDGSPIRQKYLETVLSWISDEQIIRFMADHQHDETAKPLWDYFESVIKWVKSTFPVVRKDEMRSVEWGLLYNEFKDNDLDPDKLEERVASLMGDEEVGNKRGIYSYVLNGQEKHLNIRKFSDTERREAFERQKGLCASCGEHFELEVMEADHIVPWAQGGKTIASNCQMLCKPCHYKKK